MKFSVQRFYNRLWELSFADVVFLFNSASDIVKRGAKKFFSYPAESLNPVKNAQPFFL